MEAVAMGMLRTVGSPGRQGPSQQRHHSEVNGPSFTNILPSRAWSGVFAWDLAALFHVHDINSMVRSPGQ